MKVIQYAFPIDYMRGNISGHQRLTYGEDDTRAWDVDTESAIPANNYEPKIITHYRLRDRLRYFCVRTRNTANMNAQNRLNIAAMSGAMAIYNYIVSHKTSPLYIALNEEFLTVNIHTLRGWLIPILRQGLYEKRDIIETAGGVVIDNPWLTSSAEPNIVLSDNIIDKFRVYLT